MPLKESENFFFFLCNLGKPTVDFEARGELKGKTHSPQKSHHNALSMAVDVIFLDYLVSCNIEIPVLM